MVRTTIGKTGIYELDLSDSGGHITYLKVDSINLADDNKIIIDLLEESE